MDKEVAKSKVRVIRPKNGKTQKPKFREGEQRPVRDLLEHEDLEELAETLSVEEFGRLAECWDALA